MNCPRDKSLLSAIQQDGIEVLQCPQCKGEWLDADELGQLVEHHARVFTQGEVDALDALNKEIFTAEIMDHDELTCPACEGAVQMAHFNYADTSGIILHKCPECAGIWTDTGELEKIEALVDGWKGKLGEDVVKYGAILRKVELEEQQMLDRDVSVSRFGFVNSLLRFVEV